MDNSIEHIWKTGFATDTNLIPPKIKNLYDRKSLNLVDTFERKYRINILLLLIGTPLAVVLLSLVGMPILGLYVAFAFLLHAFMGKRYLNQLQTMDKMATSYEYLKNLKSWLDTNIAEMGLLSRFFYPGIIIIIAVQLRLYTASQNALQADSSALDVLAATPTWAMVVVMLAATIFAFLGRALYVLDLKSIYGKDIKHLEEILADMELLRDETA